MRVHKDLVLKARMRLLSHDGRVLRGEEGLRVYRTLFPLAPRVYGSRLAYVLIEASRRPALAALPGRRRALLDEALAAARALDADQPYRAKMLDRALRDLALLDTEGPDTEACDTGEPNAEEPNAGEPNAGERRDAAGTSPAVQPGGTGEQGGR